MSDDDGADSTADEPETAGKTRFLPLLGDKAREPGYELPLPFGISAAAVYLKRDIDDITLLAVTGTFRF